MKTATINVEFTGVRPMMFNRYAGDNNTQLPAEDKMYLTADRCLMLPAINLFSLLAAENTKSVCRQFFGKGGRSIGLGIAAFVNIEPFDIPIMSNGKEVRFVGWNDQIEKCFHVGRLSKGVPNPVYRPKLNLPWNISFQVSYIENKQCTIENLRSAFSMGGILGIGSFRPYFGRYELTKWDVQ